MRYQAVLFDFNGVILWDRQWHERAWDDLSEAVRGRKLTREESEQHVHGRTPGETLEFILGHAPTPAEAKELLGRKERLYQEACLKSPDFHLSPGADKLFDLIQSLNLQQTIATSSPLVNIRFYYEHLGLDRWFPVEKIVYDDGSFRGKPAPDVYLKAAAQLGVEAHDCVAVEDAKSGVQAAAAAGAGEIIAVVHGENATALQGLPIAKFVKNLGEITAEDL